MGVSSSESHDLTAFYELLTASFGVLSQNTGFYPSLDRIVETTLGPLNLGPGGGAYNEPVSHLHRAKEATTTSPPQGIYYAIIHQPFTYVTSDPSSRASTSHKYVATTPI